MSVRHYLPFGYAGDSHTIYECRQCGTTLQNAEAACPYCGPSGIAVFEL